MTTNRKQGTETVKTATVVESIVMCEACSTRASAHHFFHFSDNFLFQLLLGTILNSFQ